MSYIKTWVERCDEHPDHQSGMVSNGMIQARMQEEIDDLREALAIQQGCCDGAAAQDAHIRREREEHKAEVEKLRAENERLREMMLDIAEELRGEEPRIVFRIRKALEGKP